MSLAKRRDGTPVWVEASRSEPLERIELRSTEGGYDEAWLQRLIHLHPSALPVSQIETGFGRPTAVCRELPLVFGAELDEAAFVDSVSRNLARGRAIVAVIGDGIREDIQPLAELLQAHAGSRFTFALVELAVYVAPGASWIVVPSVLAQTLLIERGVVSIRETAGGQHRIEVTPTPTSGPAAGRSASLRIASMITVLRFRVPIFLPLELPLLPGFQRMRFCGLPRSFFVPSPLLLASADIVEF